MQDFKSRRSQSVCLGLATSTSSVLLVSATLDRGDTNITSFFPAAEQVYLMEDEFGAEQRYVLASFTVLSVTNPWYVGQAVV